MSETRVHILFVCLGNVCRSPMAECVTLQMLRDRGQEHDVRVASRGTAAFNAGKPADPRATDALRSHGFPMPAHLARQISDEDFATFGQIVAMDRSNLHTLTGWRPPGFAGQLRLLPSSNGAAGVEVPDPFYGDAAQFTQALGLIRNGVAQLLDELLPLPS